MFLPSVAWTHDYLHDSIIAYVCPIPWRSNRIVSFISLSIEFKMQIESTAKVNLVKYIMNCKKSLKTNDWRILKLNFFEFVTALQVVCSKNNVQLSQVHCTVAVSQRSVLDRWLRSDYYFLYLVLYIPTAGFCPQLGLHGQIKITNSLMNDTCHDTF